MPTETADQYQRRTGKRRPGVPTPEGAYEPTTDFQSTGGLAAAARRKKAEAAESKPDDETTVDEQAEALSTPRKKKKPEGSY